MICPTNLQGRVQDIYQGKVQPVASRHCDLVVDKKSGRRFLIGHKGFRCGANAETKASSLPVAAMVILTAKNVALAICLGG